jgi:hypothetical protein
MMKKDMFDKTVISVKQEQIEGLEKWLKEWDYMVMHCKKRGGFTIFGQDIDNADYKIQVPQHHNSKIIRLIKDYIEDHISKLKKESYTIDDLKRVVNNE